MSKNLKKKIIAGVVGLSLVGGTVASYASVNAAGKLNNWFVDKRTASFENIANAAVDHAASRTNEVKVWYNETKTTASGHIVNAATDEIDRANAAINTAADSYVEDINEKAEKIMKSIPGQYRTVVNTTNGTTDALANQLEALGQEDIENKLNKVGAEQLGNVTTGVTATKEAAVARLEKAIADAKAEILALMAEKETAATANIIAHIDAKIAEKQAAIAEFTAQLETAKKGLITAEGQRIEGEAKADLDALVEGIVEAPAAQ